MSPSGSRYRSVKAGALTLPEIPGRSEEVIGHMPVRQLLTAAPAPGAPTDWSTLLDKVLSQLLQRRAPLHGDVVVPVFVGRSGTLGVF